jgi:hypothetical protein
MTDINTLAQYNQKIVESLTINVHFIFPRLRSTEIFLRVNGK